MLSLTILFFVIAILTISFNFQEVVLSASSICGTLLAIFLMFFTVSKIVGFEGYHRHHPYYKEKLVS